MAGDGAGTQMDRLVQRRRATAEAATNGTPATRSGALLLSFLLAHPLTAAQAGTCSRGPLKLNCAAARSGQWSVLQTGLCWLLQLELCKCAARRVAVIHKLDCACRRGLSISCLACRNAAARGRLQMRSPSPAGAPPHTPSGPPGSSRWAAVLPHPTQSAVIRLCCWKLWCSGHCVCGHMVTVWACPTAADLHLPPQPRRLCGCWLRQRSALAQLRVPLSCGETALG